MKSVPYDWDDPDRRDDALLRCLEDVYKADGPEPAPPRAEPSGPLTRGEIRALEAFSYGLGRAGTAEVLGVTLNTVKTFTSRARRKLQAKDTTHAVAIALRQGLIR